MATSESEACVVACDYYPGGDYLSLALVDITRGLIAETHHVAPDVLVDFDDRDRFVRFDVHVGGLAGFDSGRVRATRLAADDTLQIEWDPRETQGSGHPEWRPSTEDANVLLRSAADGRRTVGLRVLHARRCIADGGVPTLDSKAYGWYAAVVSS